MRRELELGDLFKSIDAMDSATFAQHLSEDVEFRFGNAPAVNGRKAVMETVQGFFQSIGGLRHELIRVWHQGDTVICHGIVTYTRKDGSTLTVPFANIFRLSDRLVTQYLIFVDISALYA